MAAAAGSSSGADGGLFALTMNQTGDSAGLVANRQEMMSPAMQAAIDVPVDHEAFAEAFARQSATLVVQGNGNAEISVTPPDMGPIRIAISMEADGAWLDIAAGHAETRAAIEASIPHLRQMLADQGVRLSDWRLREESASDSRPANGGEASRQSGHPGDGTRSDPGQQRAGADAAAHQGSGYGHGEARGRGPQPAHRWTQGGPLTAAPQPAIGPGAAGSDRRLDLYA
jgi:flagellar hook-length control protein FliK